MVSRVSRVSRNSVAVKNTVNIVAKNYMIVRSSAALLTRAVKPDANLLYLRHGFVGNWTTCRYANSCTANFADYTTHILGKLQTGHDIL